MESRFKRNGAVPRHWLYECCQMVEFLECVPGRETDWTSKATILETLGYRDRFPKLLEAIEIDGIFQLLQEIAAGQPWRMELFSLQLGHLERTLTLLQEILEILIFAHRLQLFRRELQRSPLTFRQIKTGLAAVLPGKLLQDLQPVMQVPPSSSLTSDSPEPAAAQTLPLGVTDAFEPPATRLTPVTLGVLSLATSALFGTSGYWFALNSQVLDGINPFDRGKSTLANADRAYQGGNVGAAVRLAQSIAPESTAYPEAQSAIAQWKQDWQQARISFAAAEEAFDEQRWDEVVRQAQLMPEIGAWQSKLKPFTTEAQNQLERQASQLLQQAYDRAIAKEFTQALTLLKQIPQDTATYSQVPDKIAEYQKKQKIRANYFLQQAYKEAGDRHFTEAIDYLQQIPQGTPVSGQAKAKMAEYVQKQAIRAEYLLQQPLASVRRSNSKRFQPEKRRSVFPNPTRQPGEVDSFINRPRQSLPLPIDPGSFLQEINPQAPSAFGRSGTLN